MPWLVAMQHIENVLRSTLHFQFITGQSFSSSKAQIKFNWIWTQKWIENGRCHINFYLSLMCSLQFLMCLQRSRIWQFYECWSHFHWIMQNHSNSFQFCSPFSSFQLKGMLIKSRLFHFISFFFKFQWIGMVWFSSIVTAVMIVSQRNKGPGRRKF